MFENFQNWVVGFLKGVCEMKHLHLTFDIYTTLWKQGYHSPLSDHYSPLAKEEDEANVSMPAA